MSPPFFAVSIRIPLRPVKGLISGLVSGQGGPRRPVIDFGIKTRAGDCEMKRAYRLELPVSTRCAAGCLEKSRTYRRHPIGNCLLPTAYCLSPPPKSKSQRPDRQQAEGTWLWRAFITGFNGSARDCVVRVSHQVLVAPDCPSLLTFRNMAIGTRPEFRGSSSGNAHRRRALRRQPRYTSECPGGDYRALSDHTGVSRSQQTSGIPRKRTSPPVEFLAVLRLPKTGCRFPRLPWRRWRKRRHPLHVRLQW
jgi:hypothetical protein